MQLMLDGFSGKHVKVFIDGVPQEGAGQAFDLNNIPAGFAERVEVYKGVVPVGFGTDAIGGVINIVTHKQRRNWFADASYSYGSFNTHRSSLRFGQTTKGGFLYEIHAFQNYSDNDYRIDNWVREFEVQPDGTIHKFPVDKTDLKHVRRFNDAFHNEVVLGKLGLVGKKWADRFVLGFSYSNFYKEIQTGVYQEIVFGEKHRKGHSFVPSLEYAKRNLLTEGLDLLVTANYNHNITRNIDTAARYYNWYGHHYEKDSRGEQSYQNSESRSTNWNATLTLNYRFGGIHTLTFNHVYNDFRRTSRSHVGTSSVLTDFSIPKVTHKNIGGLSYRVVPSERWNASTDRIGFACGRHRSQYYQTIWAADNGDLYVFSPGYGRTFTSSADLKKIAGTKPSGVVRIRKGAAQFDPDYYVNFEEIGTRHPIFRCWHISGAHFLLQLYADGVEGMMQGKDAAVDELAVFDAEKKTVVPVTGLPSDLAGFGGEPYGEDGAMYIAVTVTGGDKPAFYKIDAATGHATKGLVIDAESIATAGRLAIRK